MKYIVLLFSLLLSMQAHAFKCYFTMVKGECWKPYDLTVDVSNAGTGKHKLTVLIPEGDLWVREEFECNAEETLALVAKFSPIFWAGQEDKTYAGKRYWKLPDAIKPDETGWNVTVCFPKYFSDVPTPPDANTNCECALGHLPRIEPRKL